jgi:transmembrane sensor
MKTGSPDIHLLSEPDRWVVLARYLSGECDPAEAESVRLWLEEDPARGELLAALDHATRPRPGTSAEPVDVERALARVKGRLHEPQVRPLFGARGISGSERGAPAWRSTSFRVAAAVALLAGAALLWRAVRSGRPAPSPRLAERSWTTGVGRTDSIPLPDGSLVLLGPGSGVTMVAGYGGPARDLTLRGEALFQVRHDAAHPFTVRAADAEIRDLGTTFGVRSDEDGVQVSVVSGSVRLQDTTKRAPRVLTLKAGDAAILTPDRQAPARAGPRREEDLAWTHGRLVFKDASLVRVRDDLRRWYGIELVLADSSLASRHLKAEFAGEPVDQVLKTIAFALGGVTIQRRGDTAIVRLEKPGPSPP